MGNKRSNNRSKHEKVENESEKTRQYKIKTGKKNKNIKKKGKKHPILRKIFKALLILCLILVIIGAGVFAGIFFGLFGDDFKITKDDLSINKNNSVVKDAEGNIIANLAGDENRKIISMADMPEYLPKAFISIEDERFNTHKGVDIKRSAAATVSYVFNRGNSSFGGSTITQQLVKNLTNEKDDSGFAGITRKVKEMSKAYQVERLISKDQILELYLNLIFLGDKAYGVEVASQYYFSKSAKDLTLAEASFLAGINHMPNKYLPFEEYTNKENPEKSKADMKEKINKRTKTVLAKMKELGYIANEEDYKAAVAEVDNGLAFKKGVITTGSSAYSYHTAATIKQVQKDLMEKNGWSEEFADFNLRNNGYVIYSTQDSSVQSKMEEVFRNDSYVRQSKDKHYTQAGMAVIDHSTGKVVGVMGGLGSGANTADLNRATQAYRQTGSSMKPISVIVPGLEMKTLTAGTVYDDSYTVFPGGYDPQNYNSFMGPVTIRDALETSQNIPQLKAMSEIQPINSIEYLRKMGLSHLITAKEELASGKKTGNDENLALSLGGLTIGASPLEMAAAYGTIANDGEYITPIFYTKVEDANGKIVIEPKQEKRRVLSEQNAYILKSLLMEPVVGSAGTAKYCKISGIDVAAKTGTTNDSKDRWLCGFTPYYAAATWYGYDTPQRVVYSGSPANPAGALWSNVMKSIHKGLENKKFIEPGEIVRATICRDTGLLAGEKCTNRYTEVFVKGTVPTETCEGGVVVTICKESGLLANEYCTDCEERVYTVKPPKEQNPNWKSSYGDRYQDPPTEKCNIHTKPADTEKPEIKLKGKDVITLKVGEKYTDPGATATDKVDGDLTAKIVIDISKVDTTKPGTYTVTYTVSDSSGNTATKTRTVKVIEEEKPTEPEGPSEGGESGGEPEKPGEGEDTGE